MRRAGQCATGNVQPEHPKIEGTCQSAPKGLIEVCITRKTHIDRRPASINWS